MKVEVAFKGIKFHGVLILKAMVGFLKCIRNKNPQCTKSYDKAYEKIELKSKLERSTYIPVAFQSYILCT